ncbi:hypothetical protein Barb4_03282 [Bacteroidales bacterium Barb4]|nr:hypothetical protein Barb4_03282 [Bacteroidales bacterium Barb4]
MRRELLHNVVLHPVLHHVCRHLYIVSARLIALGGREIGECAVCPFIFQRGFGQKLQEVLRNAFVHHRRLIHTAYIRRRCGRVHAHTQRHFRFRVILHPLFFVIQTETGSERQPAGKKVVQRGLMEKSSSIRRCFKATGDKQFLVYHTNGRHLGVLLFQRSEYLLQHADTVFLESDRRIGAQIIMKAVETGRPLIVARREAFHGYFLTESPLKLLLCKGKLGNGVIVLIHLHVVVKPLMPGSRGQNDLVRVVFQLQVVCRHPAIVAARVVDGNGQDFIVRAVVLSVRESPLRGIIKGKGIGGSEAGSNAPVHLEASARRLLIVRLATCVFIGEKAVASVVIPAGGKGELVAQLAVMRSLCLEQSVVSAGHRQLRALKIKRRKRADVNNPAHRIPAVKCALRAAKHFNPLNVGQLKVKRALVQIRNVVHIKTDRLPAAPRPDAANVNRRRQLRPVSRHIEVGDGRADVFQRLNLPSGYELRRKDGHGAGQLPQIVCLLRRSRYHDLLRSEIPDGILFLHPVLAGFNALTD